MPKAVKIPPKVSRPLPSPATGGQRNESNERSDSSKRTRKINGDELEEVGGVAWIVILLLSLAALLAAYWLAFEIGIETLPQSVLFWIICSLGFGGIIRAFGGSAELNWKGIVKATGIAALVLGSLLMIMGVPGSKDQSTGIWIPNFKNTAERPSVIACIKTEAIRREL
ncbi:hypothetical protein [Rhizobium beringeri]|uniref:hypothetical protein n=1 Tax=Rhizobium beringeri TaxID=3019934 RepID=UPI002E10ABB5|nr:hypothetical protein U8P69_23795 [Rhizobium beringeri]